MNNELFTVLNELIAHAVQIRNLKLKHNSFSKTAIVEYLYMKGFMFPYRRVNKHFVRNGYVYKVDGKYYVTPKGYYVFSAWMKNLVKNEGLEKCN